MRSKPSNIEDDNYKTVPKLENVMSLIDDLLIPNNIDILKITISQKWRYQ